MAPLNLYRTDGKQLGVVTSITLKEKPKTGLYCFSLYLKQDIKYSLNEDIQIWKSVSFQSFETVAHSHTFCNWPLFRMANVVIIKKIKVKCRLCQRLFYKI